MWVTTLANVAGIGYVMSMNTTTEADMTNAHTLLHATEQLEAAEIAVRVAEVRLNALVPGAPLQYSVEATRRLRAADADLEAARVAYDAAQDLLAPED